MTTREFSAKTTEEAISEGLRQLGCTLSDVKVEVLDEGAKGLFGLFGSKPARVRLTVKREEDEDDGMSDILSSLTLNPQQQRRQRPARPETTAKAEPAPRAEPARKAESVPKAESAGKAAPAPKTEPARTADTSAKAESARKGETAARTESTERTPRTDRLRGQRGRGPRAPRPEGAAQRPEPVMRKEAEAPSEPPVLHDPQTPEGRAQKFLMDVTNLMGVPVSVYVDKNEDGSLYVRMVGDTLGILIGRRGETLDALQYLASLQVNKGREGYTRVTLDTENYRAKREESLRRLASRMAQRAVKTGRKVVLEPMNPYERRVLHASLQNHPNVTTHSEGEEPNRHVVITLKGKDERPEESK